MASFSAVKEWKSSTKFSRSLRSHYFSQIPLTGAWTQAEVCVSWSNHCTLSLEFCIQVVHIIYVFKQSSDSNFENFLSGQTMVGPRFKISPWETFYGSTRKRTLNTKAWLIWSFHLRSPEGLWPILWLSSPHLSYRTINNRTFVSFRGD